MGLLALPELLPRGIAALPTGDNSSDTIINGVHFNTTALRLFNYTYYDNDTISNNSKCYLIFNNYKPVFLDNGTWINGTTCYVPIFGIKQRGKIGIAFAALFSVCLLFTMINLRKHGQQFLHESKRFRLVGRRWQWYWCIFASACGLISTITSVDVDRDYLQDLAIILQSFFFYLMYPATLAMVWEATRHWGSWQERQIVDRDQFALPEDDRRAKTEFFLPLIFYMFTWLEFFMTIPRGWTAVEKQRSPEQQASIAAPAATDNRFKAGSFIAIASFLTIIYMLRHHLQYYRPHHERSGLWNRASSVWSHCPGKLYLAIIVLAVRVAYGIASSWIWDISVMKFDGHPSWPYGAGYAPSILIMVILNIAGLVEENEDRVLIRQRRERGRSTDAELGITRKPHWWRRNRAAAGVDADAQLRELVNEVPAGGHRKSRSSIELGPVSSPMGKSSATTAGPPVLGLRERSRSREQPDTVFRDESPSHVPLRPGFSTVEDHRRGSGWTDGSAGSAESAMTGTTLQAPQQKVRSMLDV